jgi:hypothetical protein
MAKKVTNQLGLAPLTQTVNSGIIIYGAAAAVSGPLTKTEQQIALKTQTHLQIIRNQRLKADAAVHEIAQIHQQGAKEFLETARHLAALQATARGKEYQALVEEFNQRSEQMAAQHIFGVLEVSARNIGMETARPITWEEPPAKEPIVVKVTEKRGWLQRLIGD